MKNIKKIIYESLVRLTEKKYSAPPEILDALKNKLKMDPLIRYVDKLKAQNSIPPSYTVFLLNGNTFDIYFEDFSLLIKIGSKEYFVGDLDERSEAIKHINKLLTQKPIPSFGGEEEDIEGETPAGEAPAGGAAAGGGSDVAMEPDEEEPEEEEEA
tara:strand:- start:71 stop:538 length:468 start_codon:yes stop_codon:yes gene_type:complete